VSAGLNRCVQTWSNLPMDEAKNFRVAVLGEALIDRFADGDVIGGAPFNVARNLALLGAVPVMITRVGSDGFGDMIVAELARFGMTQDGLQRDPERTTGIVDVQMSGTLHRFEIGADAAWDHIDAADAVRVVRESAPRLIYFGTLAQRGAISRAAIHAALDASDGAPFLDLNLRDGPDNRALAEDSLNRAKFVKLNDDELDRLVAWFLHPAGRGPRDALELLVKRFDLERITVTRGAEGWSCLDASQGGFNGAATPVKVRDTVGAGDAFAAVLLLGELSGWALPCALQRASAHASAVCGIAGAVDAASDIYAKARAGWATEDGLALVIR
jgi:fructokinase